MKKNNKNEWEEWELLKIQNMIADWEGTDLPISVIMDAIRSLLVQQKQKDREDLIKKIESLKIDEDKVFKRLRKDAYYEELNEAVGYNDALNDVLDFLSDKEGDK